MSNPGDSGLRDSLRRDDLRPSATPEAPPRRLRTMWRVMFGGARHPSARLYPVHAAKRLAARFNRLYRTDVAYADRFGKVSI